MHFLGRFKRLFSIAGQSEDLLRAQLRALARQIPLLYFVLIANVCFVSATHFHLAPFWLTVVLPAVFVVFAIKRQAIWLKLRNIELPIVDTLQKLRSTTILVAVLGCGIIAWSFVLLPYGGPLEQAHIAFFMAVTTVSCAFCLMHLRPAAILLTVLVCIPFAVRFFLENQLVFVAMAANVSLVAAAMIFILYTHYNDFARMVQQRSDLEREHRETQRLSDENYRLANIDSLTSLPNRRNFFAMLEKRVADNKPFAVGLLDLDGFKAVNDLYGHAIGDALLKEASLRLKALSHRGFEFARLGGDEFGFIVDDVEASAQGLVVCETLRQTYVLDHVAVQVAASCGIARYPLAGQKVSELVEYADYALYEAKQNAPGRVMMFNTAHRDALRLTNQIDQTLRNADLKSELALAYQPTFDTITGKITCVEALARWSGASLVDVPAIQLITTAERSQIINQMTIVLLERLLEDMKHWPGDVRVAFNLSARSLASSECMLQIIALIQNNGIDPRRLEFEVTETAVMIDFEASLRALNLLRNLGCSIALDDFGTGYSSLSYVHRLPLDKVKIDGSFVREMLNEEKASNIVKTIIGMAGDLKLNCVAEAVETEEQAQFLRTAGCHQMQGFLFAKPMPPEAVAALLVSTERASQAG